MAYITNQSCSDFQQGGYLYKPTSGIQWTPKHSWMSDRHQKQVSAKADPQHLVVVYWQLGSLLWSYPLTMRAALCHSVCKWWVMAKQVKYRYVQLIPAYM